MNFIIFWCVILILFSFSFVLLLATPMTITFTKMTTTNWITCHLTQVNTPRLNPS